MGLVQQCARPMVVHNEIIEKELEAVEGTQYVTKESILRRAQEIKGIPLRDVDKTGRLATGKGAIGTVIEESWFGYTPNSESEPDFPEAGVELKVTPYLRGKNGIRAKERLVCNIINYVCQDIAKAKINVPDHDLLVGGFPCQDYSVMKKNSAGIEGAKGALWWQIDDILREKRPKYVLLENVDRLIRSPAKQPGRDFSIILRCLYEKGYAVEWRVINAAEYGYAQRRRRTFIMAYHNQTEIFRNFAEVVCVQGLKSMHKHIMENGILAKAFPVQSHSRSYVENWIDELEYADISTVSRNQRVYLYKAGVMMNGRIYSVDVTPQRVEATPLKDILEKDPVDEHYSLRTEDMPRWTYAKGAKREKRQRRDGSQYYFSEGSVQFPESLNKPSRTMLTSESQVGRTSHAVQDPMTGRLRVLTPIECERLNGFPDNWTDTGMPERMRYFCMGNALVVPLIKRIGRGLLSEF